MSLLTLSTTSSRSSSTTINRYFALISVLFWLSLVDCSEEGGEQNEQVGVAYGLNHDAILLPDAKKVIFLAGPNRTLYEETQAFFHKWGEYGWKVGHPTTHALRYWRWANPDSQQYDEHVFDLLVEKGGNYNELHDIFTGIEQQFKLSDNGVLMGSVLFDQVGEYAHYDSILSMNDILEHLDVPANNVTVILNYRAPRIEQWISIYKHYRSGDQQPYTYEEFMCEAVNNTDIRFERLNMIDTAMNVLRTAYDFLRMGWNVKLIDLAGVQKAKRDVTHVIGCDILLSECSQGYIAKHSREKFPGDKVSSTIEELGKLESDKVERIFRYRDCAFRGVLDRYIQKNQLEIIYQESIWSDCDDDREAYYDDVKKDSKVIYDALVGQLPCVTDPKVIMDEVLGIGEYQPTTIYEKANSLITSKAFFYYVEIPILVVVVLACIFCLVQKIKKRRIKAFAQAVRQAETSADKVSFRDNKMWD